MGVGIRWPETDFQLGWGPENLQTPIQCTQGTPNVSQMSISGVEGAGGSVLHIVCFLKRATDQISHTTHKRQKGETQSIPLKKIIINNLGLIIETGWKLAYVEDLNGNMFRKKPLLVKTYIDHL